MDPRDESLYIVDGKILLKLTREGRLKIAAGIAPEATQGSYEPPTETNIPTQTEFKAPLVSAPVRYCNHSTSLGYIFVKANVD